MKNTHLYGLSFNVKRKQRNFNLILKEKELPLKFLIKSISMTRPTTV
jgi:hypothetical protein